MDFLIALLIALLLTAIFAGILRGHRFGAALIFFFVVLLLATWAGGVWITPLGPEIWGVKWLSFVLVGLFFALVLTVALPPDPGRRTKTQPVAQTPESAAPVVLFGLFFWVLIGALVVALMAHYLR
ncbi:MAG: hypothetical protein ACLFUL_09385 [Desulfobacteraceae bacterium]